MKVKKVKVFDAARGFYGRRKNCWAIAVRAVHKAWQYAYVGRRLKKREYRATWIQQINAGARQHGLTYAQFIKYLPVAGLDLNRKSLATLAATEPFAFKAIADTLRAAGAQPFRTTHARAQAVAAVAGATPAKAAAAAPLR
jgi:large subunit ribosomal protein L20